MPVNLALGSLAWHGEQRAGRPLPLWCRHTCVSTEGTSFSVESWAMLLGSGGEPPGTMTVDGFVSVSS